MKKFDIGTVMMLSALALAGCAQNPKPAPESKLAKNDPASRADGTLGV